MTNPRFQESYGSNDNTQMVTSVRKIQRIGSIAGVPAAATTIALTEPSRIVNNTATAGWIAYLVKDGDGTYIVEYFTAGQEKKRRIVNTAGIGGSGQGTTVTTILVCES